MRDSGKEFIRPKVITQKDVSIPEKGRFNSEIGHLLALMQLALARHSVKPIRSIRYRHQRAAQIFYMRPRRADIPRSLIRSDAVYSIPWWASAEVKHIDIQDETETEARPDGAKVITESQFSIKLLDGRKVIHQRTVLISKNGRRFKEFSAILPNGKKAEFNTIPKELTPLYGFEQSDLLPAGFIVICEGVNATEALIKRKLYALGTLTGALGTPSRAALQPIVEKKVPIYLWPDNDDVGVQHMERIAQRLHGLGVRDLFIVRWIGAPRKSDAANYEGSNESILKLIKEAKKWEPSLAPRHRGIMAISSSPAVMQLRLSDDERPSVKRIR